MVSLSHSCCVLYILCSCSATNSEFLLTSHEERRRDSQAHEIDMNSHLVELRLERFVHGILLHRSLVGLLEVENDEEQRQRAPTRED